MTGDNPVSGYEGFENPDSLYYGYSPSLPEVYTGSYQVRQFGVGGSNAIGVPINILQALASPPENMVTAADAVLVEEVVTQTDKDRYFPAT
jgi:hypothetical protein